MKDIDRNINSIIYDNLAHINILTNSEINAADYEIVYSYNTNYTNVTSKETIFSKNLAKGEYLYLHAVSAVTSNNHACVFSLCSKAISRPIVTYSAQSPLSETNLITYYSYRFNFDNDSIINIIRNEAIQPEYNFKGIIYILRRK